VKKFKFIINEYFALSGNQIGIIGEMQPDDFPIVSSKHKLKLMQKDKVLHNFKKIGEEIPVRDNKEKRIRAFRTSDDVKNILSSNDLKNLYIIGENDED
jgi:hypothetical protein